MSEPKNHAPQVLIMVLKLTALMEYLYSPIRVQYIYLFINHFAGIYLLKFIPA